MFSTLVFVQAAVGKQTRCTSHLDVFWVVVEKMEFPPKKHVIQYTDITIVFVFIWMRIERYSVIFSVLCALYLHVVMFFAAALCPYW